MCLHSLIILLFYVTCTHAQSCLYHLSDDKIVLDNGIHVPFDKVQKHVRVKLTHIRLTRALYHFHEPSGVLTACAGNLRLNVTNLDTYDTPTPFNPPVQITVDGQPQPPLYEGPVMKRVGRVQFAHDPVSDELLAVIAPGLHLRRIHSHFSYSLLIDVHTRRTARDYAAFDHPIHPLSRILTVDSPPHSPVIRDGLSHDSVHSSISTTALDRQDWRPDCFTRKMEVEIMWDRSFCAMFENNVTFAIFQTRASVTSTISVFDRMTCVLITIIRFSVYCNRKRVDPLARPTSLDACSPSSPACSRPLRILETVRNLWWSTNQDPDSHDAVLFLSGYDDGTPVVGAAYVAGVCTSYRFGWVEGLEYAVIGHELGHLLGAPHSASGLMSQVISLTDEPALSKSSARSIWNFVKKRSTGWCLSRDSDQRNARSIIQNFSIPVTSDLTPIGFDLYFNTRFKGVKFMMVLKNDTDPAGPVTYFSFTRLSLSGEDITNETRNWKNKDIAFGPYVVPMDQPGQLLCSDVALSRFGNPIVLTIRQMGNIVRARYLTVLGTPSTSITKPKSWGNFYSIPVQLDDMRVQSCAIDTTDSQFIFVFARAASRWNNAEILYNSGRHMSWSGAIQNGWTRLFKVPVVIPGRVVSIKATIFKVIADYEEDLILSYIFVDKNGVSNIRIVVGFGLNADGSVSGGWSGALHFIPPEEKYTRKDLGFGIDVSPREQINGKNGRSEQQRLPTVAYVDTVVEDDFYRVVMHHEALADGMFNRANVTEHAELVPPCEQCYSAPKADRCVTFRLSCSEVRSKSFPIDTAITDQSSKRRLSTLSTSVSLSQESAGARQAGTNGSGLGYPDLSVRGGELFCAGVYKLFIVKTGGDCAGKVSNMWIATAGLAQKIEEKLPDEIEKDEDSFTYSALRVSFDVNGATSDDDLHGGFADNVRNKGPSNIKIYYNKKLRVQTIRNALRHILSASDYSYWFQNKKKPKLTIKPAKWGKYKFLHILTFPWAPLL